MFISTLDLFKIGIGPSSSHTIGPMVAAYTFGQRIASSFQAQDITPGTRLQCTLTGSLALTGIGHGTDRAILLGLHGYQPAQLIDCDLTGLLLELKQRRVLQLSETISIAFSPQENIIFNRELTLAEHPNGMIFTLGDINGSTLLAETYFSIGGGFINTLEEIKHLSAPLKMQASDACPYGFDSGQTMLAMAQHSGLSIAAMKQHNELVHRNQASLDAGLDSIISAMHTCVKKGLAASGILPGGLQIQRRAAELHQQLVANPDKANTTEWLCAYAMAVNEENAAGHMVVTAPTNGAAGVIPAITYYLRLHEAAGDRPLREFLLTAAAIGGIIKHRSSISGAEVGCQGEVGSAAAMAAAGLCAVWGGSARQIENAAEIALEHHLGMTCDPVQGLVQVPCIERNGFGAVKAFTAASLAIRGSGKHFMPLDGCIAAMKQTGQEMSVKYKETSLGGLAVSLTEC